TLTDTTSNGGNFLVKRNSLGQYDWAIKVESFNYINIVVDKNNALFSSGGFGSAFDPSGGVSITKYDTFGNLIWNLNKNTWFLGGTIYSFGRDNIYIGSQALGGAMVLKVSDNISTSIKEDKIRNNSNLKIYPNPSQGSLQINYIAIGRDDLKINVIDAKGQLIYTETISSFEGEYSKVLDLGKQSGGLYFIEILNGKNKAVQRIVLN
nr:T9SS type A sorting domain-containing protein [Bacteroidota bacterium]